MPLPGAYSVRRFAAEAAWIAHRQPNARRQRRRSGKTIRLTPGPWATGALVAFEWTAGTKVVGHQAGYKPKKGVVGKKLKATLTATRAGCADQRAVLSFGKVQP